MAGTSRRGFAAMDARKQREIASRGGRAAHERGTAHEFTPEEARRAGRRGGQAVSRDRAHMAEIGRRGGERSHGGRGREFAAATDQRSHPGARGANRNGSHGRNGSQRSQHMAEIGRRGGERSHGGRGRNRSSASRARTMQAGRQTQRSRG
jgi:uncharacterized protein